MTPSSGRGIENSHFDLVKQPVSFDLKKETGTTSSSYICVPIYPSNPTGDLSTTITTPTSIAYLIGAIVYPIHRLSSNEREDSHFYILKMHSKKKLN
jgi:hypothetical protein